jgi:conjugative transposon TraM protein
MGEDTPVESPEEEVEEKPRRRRSGSRGLSDRELFELERQLLLEQKRRELELKFGIANQEQPAEPPKKSAEIVVGKQKNKGFYGLASDEIDYKPDIRALVHGEYRNIKTGAIVKFRIIDEFTIDGVHIPKNTFVYGQLSFSSTRAMIRIENIQYRNTIIPFNASIYDQDGFEGLYTPDNIVDEAKRKVANDVISSTNVNFSGGIPFVNSAANALTSAVKSISQSVVKEKKLNISSNYQVNIRYE